MLTTTIAERLPDVATHFRFKVVHEMKAIDRPERNVVVDKKLKICRKEEGEITKWYQKEIQRLSKT